MKRLVFYISLFVVIVFVGQTLVCCNGKGAPKEILSDSLSIDSIFADSLSLGEDVAMPRGADELFDDFMYNFLGNRRLQIKRIQFPLTVNSDGTTTKLSRAQWRYEPLFMTQDYFTLIADDRDQLALVKDTLVEHAVVERISLDKDKIEQFVFNRIDGKWMLTEINNTNIEENANQSFLKFYAKFATDEEFQQKSLCSRMMFTYPNPDDDFSTITGTIVPQQWKAMRPDIIPSGVIYNVVYGNPVVDGNQKIFVIRGISNGFEQQMVFEREGNAWKVKRLIT